MFESTTLQRLNQSIGRTKARQEIRTWTKVKSASAPPPAAHVKQDGAFLLLAWFAGNVVVATLAWFLVSLLLK